MVECTTQCPPEFLSGAASLVDKSALFEPCGLEPDPLRRIQTEPAPAVIQVGLLQACEGLRRAKSEESPQIRSTPQVGLLSDPPGLKQPCALQAKGAETHADVLDTPRPVEINKAPSNLSYCAPPPLDLGSDPQYLVPKDWSISARNTFLDVQVPGTPSKPPLLRARTEPEPDIEAIVMGGVDSIPPPPPMLALDFFETDDPFETPQKLEECIDRKFGDEPADMGLAFVLPPPPVPLGMLPPPPLPLQCFDTDDPMEQSIVESTGMQQAPLEGGALTTGEDGSPPPPLQLETFGSEDPFEAPQQLADLATQPAEAGHSSESGPAFMNMYQMHTGILQPPPSSAPPQIGAPLMFAPLLPPPPMMMAPVLDEPDAPAAPLRAPSESLKDDHARPSAAAMRERGMLCCIPSANGCTHVHWALDARKLVSFDKQVVSPAFKLDLPGQGSQPFKMVVYPKVVNAGKHGAGFRKAKGKGRVVLKCEAQLPEDSSDITLRISVGRADKLQLPRGPVTRNFHEHSCHGLPKEKEMWDFPASIDEESGTVLVSLELAPVPRVVTNPIIWWDETA